MCAHRAVVSSSGPPLRGVHKESPPCNIEDVHAALRYHQRKPGCQGSGERLLEMEVTSLSDDRQFVLMHHPKPLLDRNMSWKLGRICLFHRRRVLGPVSRNHFGVIIFVRLREYPYLSLALKRGCFSKLRLEKESGVFYLPDYSKEVQNDDMAPTDLFLERGARHVSCFLVRTHRSVQRSSHTIRHNSIVTCIPTLGMSRLFSSHKNPCMLETPGGFGYFFQGGLSPKKAPEPEC